MTTSQTRRKEQDIQAARQIAPISNWVKPARSPVTLPTPFKPTYEQIERLQSELDQTRAEKFQLEKQLAHATTLIAKLNRRLAEFLKDERS